MPCSTIMAYKSCSLGKGGLGKGAREGFGKGVGQPEEACECRDFKQESSERDRAQHPIALQSCGLQIAQIHLGIKACRHCVTGRISGC